MAKKVAVPNLVGTTQDSAEATLTDAGLGVIRAKFVPRRAGPGLAHSQSPGKVAKGDVVTIDILRSAGGARRGRSERRDQVHR